MEGMISWDDGRKILMSLNSGHSGALEATPIQRTTSKRAS